MANPPAIGRFGKCFAGIHLVNIDTYLDVRTTEMTVLKKDEGTPIRPQRAILQYGTYTALFLTDNACCLCCLRVQSMDQ